MLIKVNCIMKYSQLWVLYISHAHFTALLLPIIMICPPQVFNVSKHISTAYSTYPTERFLLQKKHLSCFCRMQNLKMSSLSGILASQPNKAKLPYTNCDTASVFTSFMPWVASSSQCYQIETFYHITQSWCKMINWKYSPRPSITSQS
jgi:hypothetical protein